MGLWLRNDPGEFHVIGETGFTGALFQAQLDVGLRTVSVLCWDAFWDVDGYTTLG